MGPRFSIDILEQGWLTASEPDGDLCSHGRLRLIIGGRDVIANDESYGISESALAMLRTLRGDHTPTMRLAERMIFHGCGNILMMGCPFGADFSVRHVGESVRIDDVVRFDSTDETKAVRFPGLSADVGEREYRREVTRFARRAKGPFLGALKRFTDEFHAVQYRDFWKEFDDILAEYGQDVA